MRNGESKYDYKLMWVSVFAVVVAAAVFFFYWDITKNVIRNILEAKLTYFLLWICIVYIFILHYMMHKDKEVKSETILTKKFGAFIDNALGGVAYGTMITTSLTLLKGIYIQKYFTDKIYFAEFNEIDLMTVCGVMIFLLYFAVMKVIDTAKEAYKIQHTQQVLTENKVKVVPDGGNDEKLKPN